ncbi:cupin [Macrococcus hajekii]|uniref:Cupin n=1 Tax=Macrococcus hajekii TaxID=198482 RepID=A0A4R6BJ85_9STAP|nr:cupin domain-containing protein [Macrococcus hajekii]TDM01571.1 cupin [Macrococcus hajekii]GGB01098.1 cupin [Macrococcus hajekii]
MDKNELKQQLIDKLEMIPHPEGGYYHETYLADMTTVSGKALFSSIYFLLETGNISHFHQIKSDELWYFHSGDALTIHMIDADGHYTAVKLGLDVANGEVPQYLVPKETIFASSVEGESEWSLVGCMVSPAFSFDEFKLFSQDELINQYPEHETIIRKYALSKTDVPS